MKTDPTAPQGTRPAGAQLWRATLVTVALLSLWLHAWVASERGPAYTSFSSAFTERLAAGHLDLEQKPDPRLLALKDPFDPQQNAGFRLLDASLYRGRYFLYFGITPFVTLLVPYFLLTGKHLSESAAVFIYCAGGIVFSGYFLFGMARSFFAPKARSAAAMGYAIVAFGSTLLLVRRPSIYELEIASAFFFLAATAWFSLAAILSERRRIPMLFVAVACLAIAIGSRPNYLFAVPVWMLWLIFAQPFASAPPGKRLRTSLIALAPLLFVGGLLGLYNFVRFGNPAEFGFRYQLMAYNRPAIGFWSIANVPYNAFRYLFGSWRMGKYFPFLLGQGADYVRLPLHHEATEFIYGVLLTTPLLWILALVPIKLRAWTAASPAGHLMLMLQAVAGANLCVLLGMGNGSYRYLPDFEPTALLAASVVAMYVSQCAARTRLSETLWLTLGGATVLWSAFFAVASQFALLDIFKDFNAGAFQRAAAVFNLPVFRVDQWLGYRARVPSLELTLPPDQFGKDEPLLVTGIPSLQDFFYLYYTGPGWLQIGFESMGHGGPVSAPFPLDYRKAHRFTINAGNLLPPPGHPLWGALDSGDVALAQKELVVSVDGTIVLDADVEFHDPKGVFDFGFSPDDDAFGRRFSGQIRRIDRVLATAQPSPSRVNRAAYGPLRLRIKIAPMAVGQATPILSIGNRPQGALLYLQAAQNDSVRLVYQSEQPSQTVTSEALKLPPDGLCSIEIYCPSLRPPSTSTHWSRQQTAAWWTAAKGESEIKWNGEVALSGHFAPADASPTTIVVGHNQIGLSGVDQDLGGSVQAIERISD